MTKPRSARPTCPARTAEDRLPGDLTAEQLIARVIRVDQAGEYGAKRIYDGQLAVLAEGATKDAIRRMARQEAEHLATFERTMVERRVRPTILAPVWHVAAFALGAGTALLGENAAMACTAAVEEVIDGHYARQAAALGDDERGLRRTIVEARRQELEHRDTALDAGAAEAPGYELLSQAIKTGTRLAIWLSERV
ncbi:MAG: demethoxyubiquinone hydroxylase family protein [Alphaproteobacteria bacterium]|nr:demethoxyubiquinone hydroxylase family protein [Alphaproteobacteria bacterium]